jgi:hypothetical protein
MLVDELNQAHETIENNSNYESVVNAIEMEWIEQALHNTNKTSIRRRRLPAQQAVWLVISMDLQRNKSRVFCVSCWSKCEHFIPLQIQNQSLK